MNSRSYNGFSGIDMTAKFHGHEYGKIQAIRCTTTREMAPIYTMGNKPENEKSSAIAGYLIFARIDHPEPVKRFDIVLKAADQHGQVATMSILGVEIWEDGKPWDPRNMYEIDKHYSYFADRVCPWRWENGTPCDKY